MIEVLDKIITAIGSSYETSKHIYNIIGTIFAVVSIHRAFYFVIGMAIIYKLFKVY